MDYKKAGVDIKKADKFVKKIKGYIDSPGKAISKIKAFGNLFPIQFKGMKNPVLVSSTDGVGTKLKLAFLSKKHDTVGIDLVAMNVNDLLCLGAKPLFFLDYIATGKLRPAVLANVVKGISAGCRQADCAFLGGETAEMPEFYKKDEYDLAGFSVGLVDKKKLINGSRIKENDLIIGLASSGIHSNGYSLARKVLKGALLKKNLKELLKPTRIYVKPVLKLIKKYDIKGIAHITGGAFYEKATKILPKGLGMIVDQSTWPMPDIFDLIQDKGKIKQKEMYRTFNMGIGLMLVVKRSQALDILKALRQMNERSWIIGLIRKSRVKMEIV